jgi:SAM-dependent methyltransferase
MKFTCNICGHSGNELLPGHYENPELSSCTTCGSNVRFRWLTDRLGRELFGQRMMLHDFPVDRSIRGVGCTDPASIAAPLAERFTYLNTFFEIDPRLDIRTGTSPLGPLDFLIASEVFEHVEPPVAEAFRNAAQMLKPGGALLMTTPWVWGGDEKQVLPELHDWMLDYSDGDCSILNRARDGQTNRFRDISASGSPGWSFGKTREHYPDLHDWQLLEEDNVWRLENRRRDGEAETFHNLSFHGGRGLALEMRLFARESLEEDLHAAGFTSIEFDDQEHAEFGIIVPNRWSHPIVARKAV